MNEEALAHRGLSHTKKIYIYLIREWSEVHLQAENVFDVLLRNCSRNYIFVLQEIYLELQTNPLSHEFI